ncbi:MAG: pilus assembly protein CpaB [Actinomycetota bacterium]|nr:pilus assembly protein CpaB [Actinomycetota bacterium]
MLVAIAAVVLAGAAAYLSYEYAHKADTRAEKNIQNVDVLVAKSDISKGTTAAQALNGGLISTKHVPRGVLPPSAVANTADLTDKVAVASIAKGQFIVGGSFVKPAEVGGFSANVPKGHQAMTITVDQSHGVAGFIQPGDMVNVLWSGSVTDQRAGTPGAASRVSAFLVPSVKVLAVGQTTANTAPAGSTSSGLTNGGQAAGASTQASSTAAPAANAGLLTLDVTPRQAEQIAQGLSLGAFYLTLDAPGLDPSKFAAPAEIVETWNLFDQHLSVVDEAHAARGLK